MRLSTTTVEELRLLILMFLYVSSAMNSSASEADTSSSDDSTPGPCLSSHITYSLNFTDSNIPEYSEHQSCTDIPVGQWISFVNTNNRSLEIPTLDENKYCIQGGQCGSRYPWYLNSDATSSPTTDTVHHMDLCTTDQTTRHTNLCCRRKQKVSVIRCTDIVLYRFRQSMSRSACGNICYSLKDDVVKAKYLTATNLPNKEWYASLPEHIQSNVVTLTLAIEEKKQEEFKEWETIEGVKLMIVNQWNERSSRDSQCKESCWRIDDHNIVELRGGPLREERLVYFPFYIVDDKGEALLINKLVDFLDSSIVNTYVTEKAIVRVYRVQEGALSEFKQHQPGTTTTEKTTPVEPVPVALKLQTTASNSQPPSRVSWVTVIVILAATFVISIVIVLSGAIYIRYRK